MTLDEIEAVAGDKIVVKDELTFDAARLQLSARKQRRLGALVLAEQTLRAAGPDAAAKLAEGIAKFCFDKLPWTKALLQWRDRISFLRQAEDDNVWPDLSDAALKARIKDWLAPYLDGKTSLAKFPPPISTPR